MPFLTLEDPNAKIKGSRDPLGAQPIWGAFARHVVSNVTGAANSVRGFSLLLLGRYYGQRLIDAGRVAPEDALGVVLRMEQLGAYARHIGHAVDTDIRGIERVKAYLEEHAGQPYIETGPRGRILADQRIYGIWGLFTISARVSGLVPDGPVGVTPVTRDLVERVYRPRLRNVESQLEDILARGGRLRTRGHSPLFAALVDVLPEQLRPEEVEFYARYIRGAVEVDGPGRSGQQAIFAELLAEHTDLRGRLTRPEAVALAEAAKPRSEQLTERLQRIICVESLLAPADALFDHVLARHGQTPEDLGEGLREHWGGQVPNLDSEAFAALGGEIAGASTAAQCQAMVRCHRGLATGKYDEAIRALVDWNADVMKGRKSAPWVRLSPKGQIDVRYRGAETLLPSERELGLLWRNQYFVDSLKNITRQIAESA